MKQYFYTHPNTINDTPIFVVKNEQEEEIFKCQRFYSNSLKRTMDRLLENKYFLIYKSYDLLHHELFTCKKVSRKGKVYFEAVDENTKEKYMISYDGWQRMIPDLIITKKEFTMKIHKEMEDWSTFIENDNVVAKWKATLVDDVFHMELQVSEDASIVDPAFYIVISQCVLYIGG